MADGGSLEVAIDLSFAPGCDDLQFSSLAKQISFAYSVVSCRPPPSPSLPPPSLAKQLDFAGALLVPISISLRVLL